MIGAGMCAGNFICQALMYNKTKEINIGQIAQYGAFGLIASVYYLNNHSKLFIEY